MCKDAVGQVNVQARCTARKTFLQNQHERCLSGSEILNLYYMKKYVLLLLSVFLTFAIQAQDIQKKKKSRKFQYDEVDFEDMMRRYFLKAQSVDLEGIYSVS